MDDKLIEKRIMWCRKEKSWWIFLLCRPLIIFCLRFVCSLIFWFIDRGFWSSEQLALIKNSVNWALGISLFFYVVALPVWIGLVVDANNWLKNLKKDSPTTKN